MNKTGIKRKSVLLSVAVVVAIAAVAIWYTTSWRPRALYEKATAPDTEQATVVDCFERLAKRSSRKWSGIGYWNLFLYYNETNDPKSGEMLEGAAANDFDKGRARLRLAQACSGEAPVNGIKHDVARAISLLEEEATRSDYNPDYKYQAACSLVEILLFEPGHQDYDKAEQFVGRYFDGRFNQRWPLMRHYGGILQHMGRMDPQGLNIEHGYLRDAQSGMPAYYRGNMWMRQAIYGTERAEYCMREALQSYQQAMMSHSRYLDYELLGRRIDILNEYCSAHTEYNDRSSLYGSDQYYWNGAVKPGWTTFTNLNIFTYDGMVRGGYPHGIGVGVWERDKKLFCGTWKNGTMDRGIFVMKDGSIYTGVIDKKGNFVDGTFVTPKNKQTDF